MQRRRVLGLIFGLALLAGAPVSSAASEDPLAAVRRSIELGTPTSAAVSLTDVSVDIPVRVLPIGIQGHIDRVTFSELALNGIPFEIDPYGAAFDLPTREPIVLEQPLRIRARFTGAAPGVFEEALLPSEKLRVTGTAKVSGTFHKWFFSVHRDVVIPIDETGPNPLAEYQPLKLALEQVRRMQDRGWSLPF